MDYWHFCFSRVSKQLIIINKSRYCMNKNNWLIQCSTNCSIRSVWLSCCMQHVFWADIYCTDVFSKVTQPLVSAHRGISGWVAVRFMFPRAAAVMEGKKLIDCQGSCRESKCKSKNFNVTYVFLQIPVISNVASKVHIVKACFEECGIRNDDSESEISDLYTGHTSSSHRAVTTSYFHHPLIGHLFSWLSAVIALSFNTVLISGRYSTICQR